MNITDISDWLRLTDEERRARLAGPEAADWIEALARYGFAEAQTLFGQLLLDGGRTTAFGWFAAAAGANHAPAINMMGRCLEHGWDVAADPVAAADCYRRAAEAGYDWGQYNFANVLLYGIGTRRDRVEAFDWYRRAADQGLAKAMNMLGRFYEEGWGRPASRPDAARWYQGAADGGDYRGMFNLAALLHRQGRVAEAVRHLRAAIDVGNPDFLAEVDNLLRANDDPVLRGLGAQAAERAITLREASPQNCRRVA